MSRMISYIIEKLGATVVLVPHVFGPGENDDRIIARKISCRVPYKHNLKLITGEYTPEELKGIIGQFDLFVSTRMHPLIHAISMGTPTIGIDYTFKTKELMKRVGQERRAFHIMNLDYNELISKIDETYSAKDEIRETQKIESKVMQKYALSNAKLIKDLIRMEQNLS